MAILEEDYSDLARSELYPPIASASSVTAAASDLASSSHRSSEAASSISASAYLYTCILYFKVLLSRHTA